MKFEFPFLKKINLGSLIKRGHSTLTRTLVNPSREWNTSLLVTIIVASGLIAYAGVDFYTQYTDSNRPEVNEEHIPKYRAQDAELLIRYHDGRREIFDSLRNDRPLILEKTSSTTIGSNANDATGTGVAGTNRAE